MTDTPHNEQADNENRPKRRSGRPSKAEGRAFSAHELDRLLVHGEAGADGVRRFPSYRELAERFGVSLGVIGAYAKAHDCMARRQAAASKTQELVDERLVQQRAERISYTYIDLVRSIDEMIGRFMTEFHEGRHRCDSVADFNNVVRLRCLLLGSADSRPEVVSAVSLEELQRRHQRLLEISDVAAELTGRVPARTADGDDEPGHGGGGPGNGGGQGSSDDGDAASDGNVGSSEDGGRDAAE